MNCRTFRRRHIAFVDDTVSGLERSEIQGHLIECARCADHDARVRRSLLLAHNLPRIEPSPEFRKRLRTRIRAAVFLPDVPARTGLPAARLAAAAVLMLSVGYFGRQIVLEPNRPPLALPPVVASVPEPLAEPIGSQMLMIPGVVASFSTGLALWPTALVADQATDYFVNTAFTQTSLTR